MISKEQRKRLQAMTPEDRKDIALLVLKKIKENREATKAKNTPLPEKQTCVDMDE